MQTSTFAPLSVVSRYLSRSFLGIFFPVLLSFVLLYFIIDTFDRMDLFLRHKATFGQVLRYLVFKMPLMLTQITPPAVVVGTLMSLGMLSRRNEIIAFRTSGISLWQTAWPIMACAAAISIGALVWNETVVPFSSRKFQQVNNGIRGRKIRGIFGEREIWYRGEHGFYSIDYVDRARQTVHGLLIYRLAGVDDGFHLRTVIDIPEAVWRTDHWALSPDAVEHILDEEEPTTQPVASDAVLPLSETIDDFLEVQREPEELSYGQLADRITDLSNKGIDASHYFVDLYLKLALPFANAVLAFVAIPIAGRLRRHPSIAAIIGVGAGVGFLYWVILGLASSLGQTGTLPPLFAAWAANGIYTLLGIALFLYSE